jgi:hypothetical protein
LFLLVVQAIFSGGDLLSDLSASVFVSVLLLLPVLVEVVLPESVGVCCGTVGILVLFIVETLEVGSACVVSVGFCFGTVGIFVVLASISAFGVCVCCNLWCVGAPAARVVAMNFVGTLDLPACVDCQRTEGG